MMIEIINDNNKNYDYLIRIINLLDIEKYILLLSINDDTISFFVEKNEYYDNKLSNIKDFLSLIYSSECGLMYENIDYYDLYVLKYKIDVEKTRDFKLKEIGIE
jgi:hypothetical protein